MDHDLEQFISILDQASRILVFTGAGISTESGISDYRSKGGLWQRFQPVTIQEFIADENKRIEYWQTKSELYESLNFAQPNKGHHAVAKLESLNKLMGIITQNIDGLHHMTGVTPQKILELHGTNRSTICLSCHDLTDWRQTYQRLKNGEKAPRCLLCQGLLKPQTISFGQALDQRVLAKAWQWSQECDCIIAVGSTLIVEPAASIPRAAKENGAKLVIVNMTQTPLDSIADLVIPKSAGEILFAALERLIKS